MESKFWMFDLFYVFIVSIVILNMDLDVISIILFAWLFFISTTIIAATASVSEATYFFVDIKLIGDKIYREAIYIREEGNFIRIIPKPTEDDEKYNSILVNKNHIMEIKFR